MEMGLKYSTKVNGFVLGLGKWATRTRRDNGTIRQAPERSGLGRCEGCPFTEKSEELKMTSTQLKRLYPDAWKDGYEQGNNPNMGTKDQPYKCPFIPGTDEFSAWNYGNWWGFVVSQEEAS